MTRRRAATARLLMVKIAHLLASCAAVLIVICGSGSDAAAGNPYSFYGSVAECAAAQRARCEDCLPAGSCKAITNLGDGNAECTTLGDRGGRGYFLICINLALAIDAVSSCTKDAAPSCRRDTGASESISSLENNAVFLDTGCGDGLDGCLATLYGAPKGDFPGPGTGGTSSRPPRNTSIDCGDAWGDEDTNCVVEDDSC